MTGPCMRAIHRELLLGHSVIGLVGDGDFLRYHGELFVPVLVIVAAIFFLHGLEIFADGVDTARRVHPADVRVEALIDKELAPGHGAIGIQAFVARHLQLRPEIK